MEIGDSSNQWPSFNGCYPLKFPVVLVYSVATVLTPLNEHVPHVKDRHSLRNRSIWGNVPFHLHFFSYIFTHLLLLSEGPKSQTADWFWRQTPECVQKTLCISCAFSAQALCSIAFLVWDVGIRHGTEHSELSEVCIFDYCVYKICTGVSMLTPIRCTFVYIHLLWLSVCDAFRSLLWFEDTVFHMDMCTYTWEEVRLCVCAFCVRSVYSRP
jgi:hypothetical protein